MSETQTDWDHLEARIGYRFRDRELLYRSLTHPSYTRENPAAPHNQRLEFLGDAVLGLVLAEALYRQLPKEREGVLTRYRSILVRGRQLSELAGEINLGACLRMGESETAQDGRKLSSVLEDAFEALVGAVYEDGGLDGVRAMVDQVYGDIEDRLEIQMSGLNPKGQLQERLQPEIDSQEIDYRVVEETGPDHRKAFTVELWIRGESMGRGFGHSKKLAEEAAAREALDRLDLRGET